jgi:hypothetical protein
MPMKRWAAVVVLLSLLVRGSASASLEQDEQDGFDPAIPSLPPGAHDPAAAAAAQQALLKAGVLLIPDSANDRVMAFDPLTGDLIDPNFIPPDPTNLTTPIEALLNATQTGILVSDQVNDVVQEYNLLGTFVRVFAPAGGDDEDILDNPRGIALRENGNLLVTVGDGTNANAVAEFNLGGTFIGNFIANGAGGLMSPFDIVMREFDYLVSGINDDTIHRYDLAGKVLPNFAPIDGFPEQVAEAANRNVLVANFTGTQTGVVEYTRTGLLVGIYNPPSLSQYRGVYDLPNGNILTTTSAGVFEISRAGTLVDTKISDVNARFIHLARLRPPGAVPLLTPWGLAAAVCCLGAVGIGMLLRRRV